MDNKNSRRLEEPVCQPVPTWPVRGEGRGEEEKGIEGKIEEGGVVVARVGLGCSRSREAEVVEVYK